jgi:hypothetical protein
MKIYIPTRGRWNKQITHNALTPKLKEQTVLVTDKDQEPPPNLPVEFVPETVKGIAATRQYIVENCPERYMVMLDDDLRLATRDYEGKILPASPEEVDAMFARLENWLQAGFAHCSSSPRFINWDEKIDEYKDCTRMMHVLAYDVEKLRKLGASFTKDVDETFSMDDFHMTLQLLRLGHTNRVDLLHRTNPSASNSNGGASTWRTLASHNRSARRLAELHGSVVAVRVKHGWQGMEGERLDVVVQWRKALNGRK